MDATAAPIGEILHRALLDSTEMVGRFVDAGIDRKYARLIAAECHGTDRERNGSRLDDLMCELLRDMGMTETGQAYAAVDGWRA